MCDELKNALRGMIDLYVALVNSGDAGHWDPETEVEVIAARRALSSPPDTISRSLSDQAFYPFIAMDREAQHAFADRLNSFHAELGHSQSLRWKLTATEGSAPSTSGGDHG